MEVSKLKKIILRLLWDGESSLLSKTWLRYVPTSIAREKVRYPS
jgi:hypothetical protein